MNGVGIDDCVRGAIVDADRAATAVLGQGLIGLEIELGNHLPQHHPTTIAGHDQVGVLAEPPQTGTGRNRALNDAGCIHQNADIQRLPEMLFQIGMKRLDATLEHTMVIPTPRIPADSPPLYAIIRFLNRPAPVGQSEANNRCCRWMQVAHIAGEVGAIDCKPLHAFGVTSLDMLFEEIAKAFERLGGRNRSHAEPVARGQHFHLGGELLAPVRHGEPQRLHRLLRCGGIERNRSRQVPLGVIGHRPGDSGHNLRHQQVRDGIAHGFEHARVAGDDL